MGFSFWMGRGGGVITGLEAASFTLKMRVSSRKHVPSLKLFKK